MTDQREELGTGPLVVAHQAGEGRGQGHRTRGAHAAKRHTGVLRFEDHADALGVQGLDEPVGDLGGEALLDLETPGEVGDHPGELGEPEEPLPGQIPDVGEAGEGKQVVLAEGGERDRPRHHQLVVALVVRKGGGFEGLGGEQLGVRASDAGRGVGAALAVTVDAERVE